jgi:methyl-accepting chemotaxis protein
MINIIPHLAANKNWIAIGLIAIILGGSSCVILQDLVNDIHDMGEEVSSMNLSMTLIQEDIHQMTRDVERISGAIGSMSSSVDKMASSFHSINQTVYKIGAATNNMAGSAHKMHRNVDSVMGPARMMRSFMPF